MRSRVTRRTTTANHESAPRRSGLTQRLLVLAATLSLTAGCTVVKYNYRSEPDPRTHEFVIGPLDELNIVVWKNHELSADVGVRPDGVLTLPLVGDIKAAGRTPTEIRDEVTKRYSDFIRTEETVITVAVKTVNSFHYTVTGNVEHPGMFTPKTYITVVEAIVAAGGLNRFAGDIFFLLRKNRDGVTVRKIPFDYRRITSTEHSDENLVIMPGDVIIVP